jgi:prepilin-type N-terminal cleavage/methylation domain-containing protein
MKNNRNFSAFSLIEISIVILIVGILVAGVTQSSRLISQAKINSAQSLTQSSPASSVKNMSLWIESTLDTSFDLAETDNSSTITNWYDINPQVSSKSNFTMATAAAKPTYLLNSINGLPAIKFDGSSKYMTAPNFSNIITKSATVFAVVKMPSALANQVIFGKRATNANIELATNSAANYWKFCDATSCLTPTNSPTPAISANNPYVLSVVYTGSSAAATLSTSTGITFFNNGTALSPTGSQVTTNAPDNSVSASLTLGASGTTAANFFGGHIGEIIIYDRALKKEERQSIETYLGKKWGIVMKTAAF